jgi:hypothetical protein
LQISSVTYGFIELVHTVPNLRHLNPPFLKGFNHAPSRAESKTMTTANATNTANNANATNTANATDAQPTMADVQAAAEAAACTTTTWYAAPTVKVVGGVVLGAAVAAIGYYAYQHFYNGKTAVATDLA